MLSPYLEAIDHNRYYNTTKQCAETFFRWHSSHPPQPYVTTNVLSVSLDLHIWGISYKWHYTIGGLVSLPSIICIFSRFIHVGTRIKIPVYG